MLGIDEPLRRPVRPAGEPPAAGAEGGVPVPPRRGLSRWWAEGGEDRRRVHGPHHGGPPLPRGPAPGARRPRSTCSCARRTRRSPPSRCRELLPPVREALGHDGHGHDRGRRVPSRSTSCRSWPSRRTRPVVRKDEDDLIYRTVDAKFNAVADDVAELAMRRDSPASSAPCPSRKPSASAPPARQARHQARDAEREEPRARGAHRRAGGPRGRRDHRHEHGRPRHRHPPWRQPRGHGRRPAARARGSTRTAVWATRRHRPTPPRPTRNAHRHPRTRIAPLPWPRPSRCAPPSTTP